MGARSDRAILNGRTVVPGVTLDQWSDMFSDHAGRRVGNTYFGPYRVSTVFLGLDHGWNDDPKWFETMVFGNDGDLGRDEYQTRCETYDEAEIMHIKAVSRFFLNDERMWATENQEQILAYPPDRNIVLGDIYGLGSKATVVGQLMAFGKLKEIEDANDQCEPRHPTDAGAGE